MRYPAALKVVRRRIGILRFELGMMNALQIDVVHDVLTVLLPPLRLLVRFLATYGNVEQAVTLFTIRRQKYYSFRRRFTVHITMSVNYAIILIINYTIVSIDK